MFTRVRCRSGWLILSSCPECLAATQSSTLDVVGRTNTDKWRFIADVPYSPHQFRLPSAQPSSPDHREPHTNNVIERQLLKDFQLHVAQQSSPKAFKRNCADRALHCMDTLSPRAISRILSICHYGGFLDDKLLRGVTGRLENSQELVSKMNAIEIAEAIEAISGLVSALSKRQMDSLLVSRLVHCVMVILEECLTRERRLDLDMSETHIVRVVSSLGWLNHNGKLGRSGLKLRSQEIVDVLVRKVIEVQFSKLDSLGFSLLWSGLANLGYNGKGNLEQLSEKLIERLGECETGRRGLMLKDEHLVGVLCSLAKLQFNCGELADRLGQEVLSRVRRFTNRSLSRIVHALGRLNVANDQIFDSLSDRICGICNSGLPDAFRGRELASLVYGLGQIGYRNDKLLGSLSERITVNACNGAFNNQDFSNIVYGFGKLGFSDQAVLDALGGALIKPHILSRFSPQGYSNIVHGFGCLGYDNRTVLHPLMHEIFQSSTLGKFTSQGLSNVVLAAGKLGYSEPEDMEVLVREILRGDRLDQFNNLELSNVILGFGKLGLYNSELCVALGQHACKQSRLQNMPVHNIAQMLYAFGRMGYGDAQVVDTLAREFVKPERLQQALEVDMAMTVYGLGLLEYQNANILNVLCFEIVQPRRLGTYSEQSLAQIIYGVGRSGHSDPILLTRLFPSVLSDSTNFDGVSISGVCYGLALLSEELDRNSAFFYSELVGFLEGMASRLCLKGGLDKFGMQQVSNLAWSLAELRFYDSVLMDALINRYIDLIPETRGIIPKQIRMILHACAKVNHKNAQFLDLSAQWAEMCCHEMNEAKGIANVMWGLTILDALTPDLFEKLSACLRQVGREGGQDARVNTQFLQACSRLQASNSVLLSAETQKMIPVALSRMVLNTSTSEMEREVHSVIRSLGVRFASHVRVSHGMMVVDVMVKSEPDIVIEVDGPFHYTINQPNGERREMGNTMFRNRMLRTKGYKVVCISWYEWTSMNKEEQVEWLRHRLLENGCTSVKNDRYDSEFGIGLHLESMRDLSK